MLYGYSGLIVGEECGGVVLSNSSTYVMYHMYDTSSAQR